MINDIYKYFFLLITVSSLLVFSCKKNEVKIDDIPKDKNKIGEEKKEGIVQNDVKTDIHSEKTEKYEPKFENYNNIRFEFSFKYPADIISKKESGNGDGCEFIYADGFNIKVYGGNEPGVLNQSLEDFYNSELKNHKDVTYKTKKNNWFVISGYDGETLFYVKMYVGTQSRNVLSINYPSNLRDKYYDAITVISKSFKEGNINQFD